MEYNILSNKFFEKLIYNGKNRKKSKDMMFRLISLNFGLESALKWILDELGTDLLDYIESPSINIIIYAISLNSNLYHRYNNILKEEDIINIVKINNRILDTKGWHVLYQIDEQSLNVIKTSLDNDSEAIKGVKIQTEEICEYCVFNNNFIESSMEYIQFKSDKIEQYILNKVKDCKFSLKYLNKNLITRDILEKFVIQDNDDSLQYIVNIRDYLIDETLIQLATSNDKSLNFKFVPNKFKTIDMSRKFVNINFQNLKYVPNQYKIKDIVSREMLKYQSIHDELLDEYITIEISNDLNKQSNIKTS